MQNVAAPLGAMLQTAKSKAGSLLHKVSVQKHETPAPPAVNADSLFAEGVRLFNLRDNKNAIRCFEEVLNVGKDRSDVLPYLANLYALDGDIGKSARYWERAVKASPDSARFRISLGLAYSELGRKDDALGEWRYVLKKIDSQNEEAKSLIELNDRR
jgi:tetratricopeptide (TPR) repeat protein